MDAGPLSFGQIATRAGKASIIARAAEIVAFILSAIALVAIAGDKIYTQSGDLALHYSFVKEIVDTWTWPLGDKPWTIGMGPYPPFSHYLAAIVSLVTRSPFIALHTVAILAVFICYFIIFRKLVSSGTAAGLVSTVVAAVVIVSMRDNSAVIGFEISYNFFYAQLIGEATLLAFIYLLTSRPPSYQLLGATALIIFLTGWIYPQTSVLMLLSYLALEVVFIIRGWMSSKKIALSSILRSAVSCVVLPIAVIINPAFRYMIHVAANNGSIDIGMFNHVLPEVGMALILVSGGMAALIKDEARWRTSASFFCLAGLSAGCATLIQYAALLLARSGSEYAVRKYSYLDITLIICFCGMLISWRLPDRLRRLQGVLSERLVFAVLPPIAALVVTCLLPTTPSASMKAFLAYEASAIEIVKKEGTKVAAGDVSSRNESFPWYLNHVITLVDFKMNFGEAIEVVESFIDGSKSWPESTTLVGDARGVLQPSCVIADDAPFNVKLVSVPCLRNNAPLIPLDKLVDLEQWGSKPPYLASGWSTYEGVGEWTDSKSATIDFYLPPDRPKNLIMIINGTAFLTPEHPAQEMGFAVNGDPKPIIVEETASNQGNPITIPIPDDASGNVSLRISFKDPVSPKQLGLDGDDNRLLGLYLNSFVLKQASN